MENQQQQEEKVITLNELWEIFLQRWWIMLLAAVVVVAGMFAFNKLTYEPEYSATATVYVLPDQSESGSSSSLANDVNTATKFVKDFDYAVKHRDTLQLVIDELKLDITYKSLVKKITTSNPSETRYVEVTVEAETPELSKQLADRICAIAINKLNTVIGAEKDQVRLYTKASLPVEPSNETGLLPYLVGAVLAALVVYIVFLVLHMIDDTVRTTEDVAKYLGVSILGEIPDAADILHRKGYGYGGYGGYGHYGYGQRKSKTEAAPAEKEEQA